MKVLVPDGPLRHELEPLPEGVELVAEPAPDVEFVVLSFQIADRLPGLFDELPGLRVAQSLSAGVDWLLPTVPPGIVVCRAVGVHDGPVSEWVVAAILAMQRRLPEFIEFQRRAEWNRSGAEPATIDDLEGHTVLVVGHGSIGRALAARLAPFGARVIGVARHARDEAQPVSALPDLLPEADAVVNLLPLTPETEKFVDAAFLARMKPGALFVNAGRGRTVDTAALLEALSSGRIRAALDVTDPEPLPSEHPLWRAPNILITPHIAGSVTRWEARGYRFAGEQIRRYAAGQPLLGVETAGEPARNA
ncbi:MAG TPA: 2-hydroxyacid dehydrogenase [Candidatus Dormibacteraeota bacterium]